MKDPIRITVEMNAKDYLKISLEPYEVINENHKFID